MLQILKQVVLLSTITETFHLHVGKRHYIEAYHGSKKCSINDNNNNDNNNWFLSKGTAQLLPHIPLVTRLRCEETEEGGNVRR